MANITGTAGNDILTGTSTDDTMFGLAGGDTLSSLAGNDVVTGGAGTDTLIVNYAAAATDVTMARPTASGPSLVSSPPGGVSVSTTGLLVASQGVEASCARLRCEPAIRSSGGDRPSARRWMGRSTARPRR